MNKFAKFGLLVVAMLLLCHSYANSKRSSEKATAVCSFDIKTGGQSVFDQFTIIDANDDGITWVGETNRYGDYCAFFKADEPTSESNDWIISPEVILTGGVEYKITFDTRAYSGFTEKLSVYYGQGANVDAQASLIKAYESDNFNPNSTTVAFTPELSGSYNIGFKFHSGVRYGGRGFCLLGFKIESEQPVVINKDLAATVITGSTSAQVDVDSEYKVTVKNVGAMAQSNYTVQLIDGNNNVLVSNEVSSSIEPGAVRVVSLTYKPTEAGTMTIKGKVILTDDENDGNNITETGVNIQVLPKSEDGEIYACYFETKNVFDQWTVIDANADGFKWAYVAWDDVPYAACDGSYTKASDDWLISPAVNLTVGKTYEVSAEVKAGLGSSRTEKLSMHCGQGVTVDSQITLLGDYVLDTSGKIIIDAEIKPSATGLYNIGLKAHSDPKMWGIYVYNVKIKEKTSVDIAALSLEGPNKLVVDASAEYKITIKNIGTDTQSNVKVNLIDAIDNILSYSTVESITPGETKVVTVPFTPTEAGTISIKGNVSVEGDVNADNNTTEAIEVFIKPTNANKVIYECPFDDESQFNEWTVINANNDNRTWKFYYDLVRYEYSKELPADDWLITKSLALEGGKTYRVSLDLRGSSSFIERVKVYYGQGATVAAQSNLIADWYTISAPWFDSKSTIFTPETTGNYNIGFWACSEVDQYFLDIDNVVIEELVSNDLLAADINGPIMPLVNKEYKYIVDVQNNGAAPQGNYKVMILDEYDNILGETTVEEPVGVNSTVRVLVPLTHKSVDQIKIKGRVVFANDDDPTNNETSLLTIDVQPAGDEEFVIIGNKNDISVQVPFNFHYATSTVQTIYDKVEIGVEEGLITKLYYKFDYTGDVDVNEYVELYLANTTTTNLSNGWVPESEFKLVYSGVMTIPRTGNTEVEFVFDNPFVYTGDNICVMSTRGMGAMSIPFVYASVHPIKENLTRQYYSISTPFDFMQEGSLILYRPNIKFFTNTAVPGTLSGNVKSNNVNIADVEIRLTPYDLDTKSNAQGAYNYDYVPSGTYTITASTFGHYDNVINGVVIEPNANTVKDIIMEPLPRFTVTGTVKDVDGNAISGATVKITGYSPYEATTGANGVFTVPNVYKANDYKITITKQNLMTHAGTFNVNDAAVDLGVITLGDLIIPPINVVGTVVGTNVNVTWEDSSTTSVKTYQLDDNSIETGWRINPDATGALGNMYKTSKSGVIESVDIYGFFDAGTGNRPVTVEVYNEKRILVGSSESFLILGNRWINVELPYVSYSGDFYLMIKFPDMPVTTHFIGFDSNGPNGESHLAWYMDDNGWVDFNGDGGKGVFAIRANVIEAGNRGDDSSELANNSTSKVINNNIDISSKISQTVSSAIDTPEVIKSMAQSGERSVKGYKVWRMLEIDQNQENKWTLLTTNQINTINYTDNGWSSLADGSYKYAVRTIYSNDIISKPTLSNMVAKGMEAKVTIKVTTNATQEEIVGAAIKLTNKDNSEDHVYSAVLPASGSITFDRVWKGTYILSITHEGFTPISLNSLVINDSNVNLDYELAEKIIPPYNLQTKVDTKVNDGVTYTTCLFSWNNADHIFDDFERHKDFAINSPGEVKWKYIDGDGANTYSVMNYNYENAGKPMAYMIFNPESTTPSLGGDEAWNPNNDGKKYLVSFCPATPPNNDWIISPELAFGEDFTISFWAKTLTKDYGLERFKVAYSTSGSSMLNFTNVVTSGKYETAPITWTKFTYKIPAEAKYVAINCVSDNAFAFMVDDISITVEGPRKFVKYEVYLDDEKLNETTGKSFTFTDLKPSAYYTAGVRAIYNSGESEMVTMRFNTFVGVDDLNSEQVRIYPNPVTNVMYVDGNYTKLEIYSTSGKLISTVENGEQQIDVSQLSKGVYLVKIYNNDSFKTVKITK